jgi:hypothetical protein
VFILPVEQAETAAPGFERKTRRDGNAMSAKGFAGILMLLMIKAMERQLRADRACFAIFACPALVIKRDCSYISIHFSLEIAEISLPIASSGKSSGDWK